MHAALMGPPSPWIVRFAPLVRSGGPVLDLACGGGRHGRHFLGRGHPVTAVDRDTRGLSDLAGAPGLTIVQADLETTAGLSVLADAVGPLSGRFACVVVANYLHRPLFPALLDALEPGGLLLYETFAAGNGRFGRPSSPAFLLRTGELLEVARGRLQVVAYEHGEVSSPKAAVIQRIAAVADPGPAPDLDGDPAPHPLPSA